MICKVQLQFSTQNENTLTFFAFVLLVANSQMLLLS